VVSEPSCDGQWVGRGPTDLWGNDPVEWQPSRPVWQEPSGPAGWRPGGWWTTVQQGQQPGGLADGGLAGLLDCGLAEWWLGTLVGWGPGGQWPGCSFSKSWCGGAFHKLRVQSAEASSLPGALPQPSMSSSSQQGL
jgi:hypothetical protein